MKKISTVVAKESRKLSQPKLTIGLDLGDRSSWYCVLDEQGELQGERKVSTTAKALREAFGTKRLWVGIAACTLGAIVQRDQRYLIVAGIGVLIVVVLFLIRRLAI